MGIHFDWHPDIAQGLERLIRAGGPGVAVFDADGTLWAGDAVITFIDRFLDQFPARAHPDFEPILARVRGEINIDTARLQHFIFAGLEPAVAAVWAEESFAAEMVPTFYDRVRELVARMEAVGIEPWICSGSPEWLIMPGAARLGIPASRVLASRPGLALGRFVAEPVVVTAGPGKAEAIRKHIGPRLRFSAGDSMSDFEMLSMSDHALVMAPPDDDGRRGGLPERGRTNGWWVQAIGALVV